MQASAVKKALLCAVLLGAVAAAQTAGAGSVYEWTQVPSSEVNPGTTDLRGIWGTLDSGDLELFVVGQAGKIFHYAQGSWAEESTGETRDLNAVYGFGPLDVLAVADIQRTIYLYDGTWTKRSSDALSNGNLYAVWGADPNNSLAAGKLRNMFGYFYNVIYIDAGRQPPANIGTATPASGIEADRFGVWGTDENNVYMAGAPACKKKDWLGTCTGGYANVSRYDGSGWAHVSTGHDSTTLYGIWGTASDDIFAVGQSGTILHFDGNTWIKMVSGTGATLRCVWGTGTGSVFALGDAGTILRYDGSAWKPLTSGTSVTLKGIWGGSASDLYAIGSNGTILHGVELPDTDDDGVADVYDNCPYASNPGQENSDGDSFGNACDNCPGAANADQSDSDGDGIGDACDIASCSVPSLTEPSGSGFPPRPVFRWQHAEGVMVYNLQVWSEPVNYFHLSNWYNPAQICDSTTCTVSPPSPMLPGRHWWWLNVWYADAACGFKVQPGGQVREFMVTPCEGPDLTEPNSSSMLIRGARPTFSWEDSGAQSINVQIHTPAGWTLGTWYDAGSICNGTSCEAAPYEVRWPGVYWWWVATWSTNCNLQVQPGGKILSFTVL